MKKADIGLIGLAVMGENLVLNMESKGFTVAVFNRTVDKVDKFIAGRGAGKNFIGCHSIAELCSNLERPRKVMMLVKAGSPVDDFIEQIIPHLEPGDIIIDGGNSHFPATVAIDTACPFALIQVATELRFQHIHAYDCFPYLNHISTLPVISAGISNPMMVRIVGATSASMPF